MTHIESEVFTMQQKRSITIAGIGPGDKNMCTFALTSAVKNADLLIGARRMLDTFSFLQKPEFCSYSPKEIFDFIISYKEVSSIVILVSGDTGFYSNADRILEVFSQNTEFQVQFLCGISSIAAFCARLNTSWEDAQLISLHGKEAHVIYTVARNKKAITLLGNQKEIASLCERFVYYGLEHAELSLGKDISYPSETIIHLTAKEFTIHPPKLSDGLWILLIRNPFADPADALFLPETIRKRCFLSRHIPDHLWLRKEAKPVVPMTKSEIRLTAIAQLGLCENSILYDIGAGTGTIGIEASLLCSSICVYSIECRKDAHELIQKNIRRFAAENVTPIYGNAPEAIQKLPAPTHAFIGGSSGKLKEIVTVLLEKNPSVRIVITAVSLEGITEAASILKHSFFPEESTEILQIQTAHNKKLGDYHIMAGENPVTLFSFGGAGIKI